MIPSRIFQMTRFCFLWSMLGGVAACGSVSAGHSDGGAAGLGDGGAAGLGGGGAAGLGGSGGSAGTVGADASADAAGGAHGCNQSAPFGAPSLVTGGVNSNNDDFGPRLSVDELTIYFSRRAPNNLSAPVDLYTATRPTPTSDFDAAVALAVDSTSSDTDAVATADGTTLFFSSDRPNGTGEFDLYFSSRTATSLPFQSVSSVPGVNSTGTEVNPFSTSDGELWFAFRVAGSTTALHLRRAPKASIGFGAPVAIAELDSTTDDAWPVLSSDKLTIYFSSSRTGDGAQGKPDIWVAHRTSATGTFAPPTDVVELNSAATDQVGWLSPDNCRLYLSSNRATSSGYDVYVAGR